MEILLILIVLFLSLFNFATYTIRFFILQGYYVLIWTVTAHIVNPSTVIIGQSQGNLICQAFQHHSYLKCNKTFL